MKTVLQEIIEQCIDIEQNAKFQIGLTYEQQLCVQSAMSTFRNQVLEPALEKQKDETIEFAEAVNADGYNLEFRYKEWFKNK